jgi:hypothetical protein
VSRDRITAKVRTNADFKAMTSWLDSQRLQWSVHAPTGKGHPYLMVERPKGGEPVKHSIACTPRQSVAAAAKVASLKRTLRAAGFENIT